MFHVEHSSIRSLCQVLFREELHGQAALLEQKRGRRVLLEMSKGCSTLTVPTQREGPSLGTPGARVNEGMWPRDISALIWLKFSTGLPEQVPCVSHFADAFEVTYFPWFGGILRACELKLSTTRPRSPQLKVSTRSGI